MPFTSPRSGGGSDQRYPKRDCRAHGARLKADLAVARQALEQSAQEKSQATGGRLTGGFLSVDLHMSADLAVDSLESGRKAVVATVVQRSGTEGTAVVAFPTAHLDTIERKLDAYLDDAKVTEKGKRKNEPLINSIEAFRVPALEDFWNDPVQPLPATETPVPWEVWLDSDPDRPALDFELKYAGLTPVPGVLTFPDRQVVLVRATTEQMRLAARRLDSLRELRSPAAVRHFLSVSLREEREWVEDLAARLEPAAPDSPAVCILDTGLDQGHPLLAKACEGGPFVAYNPAWGVADHHGHGTQMAGLALYLDSLEAALLSGEPVPLTHGLESGKILPPKGKNPAGFYGNVTQAVVALVELERPRRRRVFSLAATADPSPQGAPTSWSSAVDQLAASTGAAAGEPRLLVCASGNADVHDSLFEYWTANVTSRPQDPAQAWNALTVGASTLLTDLEDPKFRGWRALAPKGDMSPCHTTGQTWESQWPNKPDLCFEGGNLAISSSGDLADPEELRLLTTNRRSEAPWLLTPTGDTSAASAQIACLGARLAAYYDDLWPETVRALLIHSARWTPAMKTRFDLKVKRERGQMLRTYGYGIADPSRACFSLGHRLTMISQAELQPFVRDDGSIKTKEMHLYDLPWPDEVLEALGRTPVQLRVTLSYFIEPAPGSRPFSKKHSYASHGLRFEVRTATETLDSFHKRINAAARGDDDPKKYSSDSQAWFLGEARNRGSIHSDVWSGTAADLTGKRSIAVYPVRGWWSDNPQLKRHDSMARYALILSLETDDEQVQIEGQTVVIDFYTEVLQKIPVSQEIEI